MLKVLSCVLAVAWVVMLHVSTANSGGLGLIAPTFWPKIGTALITIAAMLPILRIRARLADVRTGLAVFALERLDGMGFIGDVRNDVSGNEDAPLTTSCQPSGMAERFNMFVLRRLPTTAFR